MTQNQKQELLSRIARRRELNMMNASRWKRFLKSPLYSLDFYLKQALAYVHPYKVRQKTLWGDVMEYYLPEASSVYYYGFWEAGLTNYLVKNLKEGDVFFDVGAHVGFYSVLASQLVGPSGSVQAFEPTPRTFISLERNLNGKQNAAAHNVAVSEKAGTMTFTDYGPRYSAFNTFKKRADAHMGFLGAGEEVTVPTVSLDEFATKLGLSPTFIKIDVEGAEHLVLRSMEKILAEAKPTISIEVGGSNDLKDNTTKSVRFLKERGYVGFLMSPDGALSPCAAGKEYGADNLIFRHESMIGI